MSFSPKTYQGRAIHCLPFVALLLLGACSVQTRVIAPLNHYDMSVPRDIRTVANRYKPDFVLHKLEDEEVDPSITEAAQKKLYEAEFEYAISTLYVGNLQSEHGQRQMFDLIRYATDMFSEDVIYEQLGSRSEPLADFVIDYQINAALSQSKQKVAEKLENEKQAQLAGQRAEFDSLVERFEKTIDNYDKKIAEYEALLNASR